MRPRTFQILGLIVFCVLGSFGLKAQSECYLIMLAANPGESVRVHALSSDFTQYGFSRVVTVFTRSAPLVSAKDINVQIKLHDSEKFRPVKMKIPNQEGCHLLLVRDLKLRSPFYFRAEWISQMMVNEYLFPPHYNGFDTTLFTKNYQTKFPPPIVRIKYRNELLSSQLIQTVNPFNGQNIELDIEISKADKSPYTAQLKAVEISFVHPNLIDLQSKYITANTFVEWPKDDSRFYWPDDFTMVPGAKIIFKCLYWYKNGQEIKESGRVTQTIEF